MGDAEPTKGELLAQANVSIRELAGGSESAAPGEWAFFCECGADGCREQVLMTLGAYGAIHDGGFAVLAPKHRVSQSARAEPSSPEVVYFRHKSSVFALDAAYAKAIASTNPRCGLAVEIFARLAADSTEPVDLDLPGYTSDARAALEAMSSRGSDAPQVAALRSALS